MPSSNSKRQRVVLGDDRVVQLDGLPVHQLLSNRARAAQRFIEVVGGDSERALVRRASRLIVGRITVGPYDIVVAPPFDSGLFVRFLLYSLRVDVSRYASEATSGIAVDGSNGDIFLRLMAALLANEVEALFRRHLSKSYVRVDRRVQALRGSVRWQHNFGRHPTEGWECTFHEQVTDDLLNRLILAGLTAAAGLLSGKEGAFATTQLSIWRQLASPIMATHAAFAAVDQRLSRLTEHYRPALALSRALTLGLAPTDLGNDGETGLNNLEFSLPALYEDFLLRLLTPVAQKLGLELDFKHRYFEALTDADGATYRRVEPDIVVLRTGQPVGVIDAKFKPRYVCPSPEDPSSPLGRVTNEDIYQLFFYQSRLQSFGRLPSLPRAVILAPLLQATASSSISKRTVVWSDRGAAEHTRPSLRVVAVPIEEILNMLHLFGEYDVAARCMPELVSELTAMASFPETRSNE